MKRLAMCLVLMGCWIGLGTPVIAASPYTVTVHKDAKGATLQVDGKNLMVFGMNWGHMPVGENYTYNLWALEESFIKEVLDTEMAMLRDMGVNAIRQFPGIPPKWVTYIYEKFGIYTVMNHTMGRYGFNVDGAFISATDYSDARTREVITKDIIDNVINVYKDTPGILMWLLGNENNYGLYWSSFEIEALPKGDQQMARATHLYTLYGAITDAIKEHDTKYPVSIANGDIQYLSLIKKHVPNLDILGTNVYRGISVRDLYQRVWDEMGIPVMYTEFGADAWNSKTMEEDDVPQAYYLHGQWREVYEQSHGKGRVGNAIGGLIFQWSDGWWKYKQTERLDIHDTHASWPNGGYAYDFVEGQNNMSEEWWGICSKGPRDSRGHTPLYPRTAYYVLQKAFKLDPYAPSTTTATIAEHFGRIVPSELSTAYGVAQVKKEVKALSWVRQADLRMVIDTYTTGGTHLLSGEDGSDREKLRFDHLESFWMTFGLNPTPALEAKMTLHAQAHAPNNRLDELFWESDGDPVRIHGASILWDDPEWFRLEGFYRTGHYHWGYEGDYWGFYREAYYGENIDIYKGTAPFGFTLAGKKALEGLTFAFGPELWWGANPAAIVKYYRSFGRVSFSLLHQEDLAEKTEITSTAAIPEPLTRRSSFWVQTDLSPITLEIGGLFAGSEKVGDSYLSARPAEGRPTYQQSGYDILEDKIRWTDTLGAKARVMLDLGMFKWQVEGGYQGLVANADSDQRKGAGGWTLKPSGRGNQWHVSSGINLELGSFKVAPAVLYQKPLEGPMPNIADYYSLQSGKYYQGVGARNVLNDPFAVLDNRETLALELRLTYDPTPATWFFEWDNNLREDADFAASLDFVYRMQPTSRDGTLAFSEEGYLFGFPEGPPAQDVWDATLRWVSHPDPAWRLVGNLFVGQNQGRGSDPRLVTRGGGDIRVSYHKLIFATSLKVNDWGRYDYHKDFNLTFPLQTHAELAYALKMPNWLGETFSRFGLRFEMRWLDEYSPRFDAVEAGEAWGEEWELRTFMEVQL